MLTQFSKLGKDCAAVFASLKQKIRDYVSQDFKTVQIHAKDRVISALIHQIRTVVEVPEDTISDDRLEGIAQGLLTSVFNKSAYFSNDEVKNLLSTAQHSKVCPVLRAFATATKGNISMAGTVAGEGLDIKHGKAGHVLSLECTDDMGFALFVTAAAGSSIDIGTVLFLGGGTVTTVNYAPQSTSATPGLVSETFSGGTPHPVPTQATLINHLHGGWARTLDPFGWMPNDKHVSVLLDTHDTGGLNR